MRRVSKKTAARMAECREFRRQLVEQVGLCELCGHSPEHVRPSGIRWRLCVHEILNGPLRQACLDKPHSVLVTCWRCNSEVLTDKAAWPEARQLAVILKRRPEQYDLVAHNFLANPRAPRRILQTEVDAWLETVQGGRNLGPKRKPTQWR